MKKDSKIPRTLLCMVLVPMLLAVDAAAQNVRTIIKTKGAISGFSKYAWQENRILVRQSPEVNAKLEKTLIHAIDRELAGKGYILDPEAPSFFIQVDAMPLDKDTLSGNTDFRAAPMTQVYTTQKPDGLGVAVIPAVISQVQITASDASGKTAVWQALVIKKYKDVDKAVRNADKEISQIFKKAMSGFPSRTQ